MLKEEKSEQDNKLTQPELSDAQQLAQEYLDMQNVLHEINIELFGVDDLDQLYRTAVELAHTRLGFERVGLYLLNESRDLLFGTYGTDVEGNICDEKGPEYVIEQTETINTFILDRVRLVVEEDVDLWFSGEVVGHGWHIGASMWAEEAPIGVIFADNLLSGQPLKSYQPELLFAYATIVSNAIQRHRLEAIITKRAAEMQAVAEIGTAATTILDIDKLLQEVVDLTKNSFQLYHAHIYLLDEETEMLVLTSGSGTIGQQMVADGRQIPLHQEQSLVARAARSHQGVVINDVRADVGFLPHPLLPDTRAEMAVPLMIGKRVLGVLDVQSDRLNYFNQEDISTFTTLGAQMAVALQNARLFTQAERRAEELAFVNRVVTEINTLDTEAGLQFMADELGEFLDVPSIVIGLVNDTGTMLELVAARSPAGAPSPVGITFPVAGDPIMSQALETKQIVVVEDVANSNLPPKARESVLKSGARSLYIIPMITGRTLIGTVSLSVMDEDILLTPEQLELAETTVYQAAATVQNAYIFAKSEERAKELALVNKVVSEVTASRDLKQSLQIIADELANVVNLGGIGIALLNEDKVSLTVVAEHYSSAEARSILGYTYPVAGNPVAQEAFSTRSTVFVEDAQNHPLTEPIHEGLRMRGVNTMYVIPMFAGTEIVGTVGFDSKEKSQLTSQQLHLAETIVYQAATAVQNTRLLTQSEERQALLRTIIDSTPDWIFVKDLDHRYKMVNQGYANSFGLPLEEFIGKNDLDVGFPEEIVKGDPAKGIRGFWTDDREIMERGELKVIDAEPAVVDGQQRWLNTIKAPLKDAAGNVTGIVGFVHDITESKRIEENLRQNEARLAESADIAKLGYWEFDVQTQLFTFTDQLYTLLGTTAEEEGGYQMSAQDYAQKFVHPEDAAVVGVGIQEALETTDPNFSQELEARTIRADGTVNHVLVRIRVEKDQEGKTVKIVGANQDITERKQVEETLRQNQADLSQALRIAKLAYWEYDVENDVFTFNDQFYELFHTTAEEHGGYQLASAYYAQNFVHPDDLPMVGSEIERALKSTDRQYNRLLEHRILYEEGGVGYISVSVNVERDEQGQIIRFYGANQDITDRKQAEEALAKRAVELETVAQVGTAASTILDPEQLLQQVVDLTKSRFGLYHAHIYLLNEAGDTLQLSAGAGEAGAKMVEQGWSIPAARELSLVAQAARDRQGVIVNDVQLAPGFMANPLLPETRSELAVPLIVGEQVLGVLDVQSDKIDYFSEEDIHIQTTLAAQIAVALQNARFLEQSEQAIRELQELSRRLTREGWQEYFTQRKELLAFSYDRQQKSSVSEVGSNLPAFSEDINLVTQPLQIQGESIGQLRLEPSDQYGEDESELLTAVTERLSAHLENLRLAEASEKDRAEAEKRSREMAIINNIVTQISTSLDLQHSLQIVVDELATAVNVDQVRIALVQAGEKEMLIIAEHYDAARATSAVGMTIPLEGNELTLSVLESRQTVVVEDAQNSPQTKPVHDLFREQGIETVILMPLVVNDEVIGTVGMDILDKRPVSMSSLQLAETIVYQTATAIQNARLFEQIQSALAETEMLYSYSSQLNTATSLDAVLDSAAAPGFQVGATEALLLVYDRNTAGNPEQAQLAAVAPKDDKRVGKILQLSEQPTRYLWPSSGQNTVFVGDVGKDDRLHPEEQKALAKQGVAALAIMYLTVGNLRLGQMIIHWNKHQTFTNADERLYGAIAQQASSVVYNRLLFNQTEEALSETATLYQASSDLNTAQTYKDVLTAMRQHTILSQAEIDATISFFDRPWEEGQRPEETITIASVRPLPPGIPNRYKIANSPIADSLMSIDELAVFEDIATDERLAPAVRAVFTEQYHAKSYVYVPLIVGGQRFGFLNGIYARNMRFSDEQLRRLNVLARQAAVTLQSIRLYEQTQEALAQTEALYEGSERIVLSSTEEDILQSLILSTELRNLDRASIFMFDDPVEDGVARDVTVVSTWVNEGVPPSVQVGTRFEVARVPFLSTVRPEASLVMSDIREDARVDEQTRKILEGFGMIGFAMFPIVVGSQWLGIVSGQSSQPLRLNDVQLRQANSLVGQAAVVMQTTILYRQEQARARREHMLRDIANKVRSSADVDTIMRTAVTEIGRTLGRRSFIKLGNGQPGDGSAEDSQPSPAKNGAS